MIDPREDKLPKWAQELLADERRRAALAWPTEARPEPLWTPGVNVYAPREMDGRTVWNAKEHLPAPLAHQVSGGFVHCGEPKSGFGFRPESSRYFATEREAALDMWWSRAEEAASRLYAIRSFIERLETPDG